LKPETELTDVSHEVVTNSQLSSLPPLEPKSQPPQKTTTTEPTKSTTLQKKLVSTLSQLPSKINTSNKVQSVSPLNNQDLIHPNADVMVLVLKVVKLMSLNPSKLKLETLLVILFQLVVFHSVLW